MTAGPPPPAPPARWLVLAVLPRAESDPDEVIRHLLAAGGRAVIEEDGRFVTHLPDPPDPDSIVEELRRRLGAGLDGEGPRISVEWQPHRDWAEVWKRGLEPRRIAPRLVVSPSWCHPRTRPGDRLVVLDPGMAFGTAEHGTTRGCLRLLDAAVRRGQRVVDVGSGSGILAIAAARLGAGEVLALEGDPWAVEVARENVAANGVAGVVEVRAMWAGPEDLVALAPRDGVVANIESGVLRRLLPGFREVLRPDGWLVLGGVPGEGWESLSAEVEGAGFHPEAVDADGAWRSGLFRRG